MTQPKQVHFFNSMIFIMELTHIYMVFNHIYDTFDGTLIELYQFSLIMMQFIVGAVLRPGFYVASDGNV